MTTAQNPSPNRGLCIDSPRGRYPTRGGRTGHNAGVESATDGPLPGAGLNQRWQKSSPMSLTLTSKRVASHWGFNRVKGKSASRIRGLIPTDIVNIQTTDAGEFLWPAAVSPEDYSTFRVPDSGGNGSRDAEDLPLEEIANATIRILESHLSAPMDELVRETARLFGFARVGRLVNERFRLAVIRLSGRGRVQIVDETVTLEA